MSRQRFIYPEIFSSEDFLSLSHGARLLFIGMFTIADDYGRGKGAIHVLQASIFGGDKLARDRVQTWAEEVRTRRMARWYVVNGSTYFDLPSWQRWQKPKYMAESKVPPFQENLEVGDKSGPNPGQNGPDPGPNPETGRVGRGRVGSELPCPERGAKKRRPTSYPDGFLKAWAAYPHFGDRSKKRKAFDVWNRDNLEPITESVLLWIEAGRHTEDWKRDEGLYVPAFQVWMNGRDFSDHPTKHEPVKQTEKSVLPWDKQNRLLTDDEKEARRQREALRARP